MRKSSKILAVLGVSLFLIPSLAGCSSSDEKTTILRVLNMEDYIYEQDIDDGYDAIDLVDQFADYIANDPVKSEKYGNVTVIYDTTDTNETLYSEMQTGKALYDLICPSDYMIQKLVSSDMLIKLDKEKVPNYFGEKNNEGEFENSIALPVIKEIFDAIPCPNKKVENDTSTMGDYAVGYMWGTLGILFNPEYKKFVKKGYEASEVIEDMADWGMLWDGKYNNTISIKDSMRDTYAVGVLKTFEDDIKTAQSKYNTAIEAATTDEEKAAALKTYKETMTEIFNRCDEDQVKLVEEQLNELKKNVFGLEVDSGKEDIITNKIGINLAWSGDAVYSMDQGEDPVKVGANLQTICYSIPELGSNLWFDAWVMPKLKESQRSEEQHDLAHEFLNFLCKTDGFTIGEGEEAIEYGAPVAQNMEYIGYTSFMGGNDTLALVRDFFDIRYSEMIESVPTGKGYETEEFEVFYKDGEEYVALAYPDFLKASHDSSKDACGLYYETTEEKDGEEVTVYEKVFIKDKDDNPTTTQKTYGDILIVDDEEALAEEKIFLQKVDMSYYFDGTVDLTPDPEDPNPIEMVLYTDCYYVELDEETHELSETVGRQFYAQYPDEKTLNRCSVMKDYGEKNVYVMKMWERFKSNSLPVWALILFILEIVAGVGLALYFVINKQVKVKLRQKRIASQE
ncbi:MAG: hypothetical protein K6C32_03330 [Bacilli bacterium]|nr:hypothetical protein [Bacilli bacterium]